MKKTTIAATITILLIIAAFTYQSRIVSHKISIPTNLNESNFLQQLTPGKTAKGFFGIPWGTNSQDVEGLSYDVESSNAWRNSNMYNREFYSYNYPSLQLNFSESSMTYPRFLFHPKYGFGLGALDISFPAEHHENYQSFIKKVETFLNYQYGTPSSRTEDLLNMKRLNQTLPAYFVQWQNKEVIIYFVYIEPSVTSPLYYCFTYLHSIKQAEKVLIEIDLE